MVSFSLVVTRSFVFLEYQARDMKTLQSCSESDTILFLMAMG